jgi:hypothetical protein
VPHCCLFNVTKIIKFKKERYEAAKPLTYFQKETKFPDHRFPGYIINIIETPTPARSRKKQERRQQKQHILQRQLGKLHKQECQKNKER